MAKPRVSFHTSHSSKRYLVLGHKRGVLKQRFWILGDQSDEDILVVVSETVASRVFALHDRGLRRIGSGESYLRADWAVGFTECVRQSGVTWHLAQIRQTATRVRVDFILTSERIRYRLSRFVGHIIKITFGIGIVQIDCRRKFMCVHRA